MTATPSMTPKFTVSGALLACIGAAALVTLVQMVDMPGASGFRDSIRMPAEMTAPTDIRGVHAETGTADTTASSVIRARN